jgi:copper oxidase (laccase) domain-containing protein
MSMFVESRLDLRQETNQYLLAVDESAVWLQANMEFGNMVEGLSTDWLANRERAAGIVGSYTAASQVIRMKPKGESGFFDLDTVEHAPVHHTDGFISTNPEYILHANPADCGEIAVHGLSKATGMNVIGLFHANRRIVGEGGHLAALEYMVQKHEIDPSNLVARLSPSARVGSYKMEYVNETLTTPEWKNYVFQDPDGFWHVDFHQRTVDDLMAFGIADENLAVSSIDTIADEQYYSHYRFTRDLAPDGANGLMYALRT